jgi:hypothetical protein
MKKILITSVVLLILSILVSPLAFAKDDKDKDNKESAQIGFFISAERNGNVKLVGTLKSISGNSLTVTSWGGDWIVDASSAKLIRRLGGTSNLSEFQAGDQLSIQGTVLTSGWSVTAKKIQNLSIQVKNADFSGTISALNVSARTFILKTAKRGDLQVSVNSDAKIYINKDKAAQLSDLSNGMIARIKGVWNRNASTVLASWIRAGLPKTATSTSQ